MQTQFITQNYNLNKTYIYIGLLIEDWSNRELCEHHITSHYITLHHNLLDMIIVSDGSSIATDISVLPMVGVSDIIRSSSVTFKHLNNLINSFHVLLGISTIWIKQSSWIDYCNPTSSPIKPFLAMIIRTWFKPLSMIFLMTWLHWGRERSELDVLLIIGCRRRQ